jgi:general secretion pathway protein A
VVLIVDEAQNLGAEALEEIRLLSNLQADKETLLQVIIVGQPSLRDRLRQPALRQLAQRVAVHYHLRPLDLQETREYIHYRLERAGGEDIFTESAVEKLYAYTKGVPRRLNAWCDLSLVAGFAESLQEIDGDFIEVVVAAQGGALEGPEEADVLPSDDTISETRLSRGAVSEDDNHLKAEVIELAGRLNRLEGLVLDLTGQLVPLISKILTPSSLPDISRLEENFSPHGEILGESLPVEDIPKSRQGWWSKLWKN